MRLRYPSILLFAAALAVAPSPAFAVGIGSLHCNDASGVPLLNNTVQTVRGIVTGTYPTGTSNRFWIQEPTGGINVFGLPQMCAIALGDDVEVTGTLIHFNGLTEISSTTTLPLVITIHSSGNPDPAPLIFSIPQFNGIYQANNCEPSESMLIKIVGAYIRLSNGGMPPVGAIFAANTNYRLTGTGSDSTTNFMTLRVVQTTNPCTTNPLVGTKIPVHCPVDVVGTASQFDNTAPHTSGYQLQPRMPGDIILNCATPASSATWGRLKTLYR